jgi:RHS repeat-associated protein
MKQRRTRSPSELSVPRAYVNWILFSDQFVPIASNCGFDLVSTSPDAVKSHSPVVNISTSGYLYVYCSNESNVDVYFDNLQLIHTRGPLLETNDYYPFGLTMAGISDKAIKSQYPTNKLRYNGKELQNQEFSDGSGLEEYDYGARLHDAQLGMWHNVDPHSPNSTNFSPYTYANNNPITFIDPNGMDTHLSGAAAQDFLKTIQEMSSHTVDVYDHLAQLKMADHGGESHDNFTVKAIYPIFESITPNIYGHTEYAINKLKYPSILTKDNPKFTQDKRDIALAPWARGKRPDGFSVDEYPYASTKEGGLGTGRPASTFYAPIREQVIQSIAIGALMLYLNENDQFLVLLINKDRHPQPYGPAYYIEEKDGKRTPSSKLIFAPEAQPQYKPSPSPILGSN